jgi:hypothetical protein
MQKNITVFNSYFKGNKTIKGSFPIYLSDSESSCISNISTELIDEKDVDLEEKLNNALITQESDEFNSITILFQLTPEDQSLYYILL